MDRRILGSWLEGPGALRDDDAAATRRTLGRPESGPGSVAGFGARLVALFVDWFASLLVARLVAPGVAYGTTRSSLITLAVFFVEVALLTSLLGASAGQRLLGLRVERLDGRRVGVGRVLLRTALLCLAVPALLVDRNGRGLHDRAAGTVVARTR